jgi:predicted phosphodiesterase
MGVMNEWVRTRYLQNCEGSASSFFSSPPRLHFLTNASVINPGFDQPLTYGWNIVKGAPIIKTENDKRYFFGGTGQDDAEVEQEIVLPVHLPVASIKNENKNENKNQKNNEKENNNKNNNKNNNNKHLDYLQVNFQELIDEQLIVLVAAGELRRPPKVNVSSVSSASISHCDPNFEDHIYYTILFRNSKGDLLGAIRTPVEDSYSWTRRIVTALIPPSTRSLLLRITSRYRAGTANEGMADNFGISYYSLKTPPLSPSSPSSSSSFDDPTLLLRGRPQVGLPSPSSHPRPSLGPDDDDPSLQSSSRSIDLVLTLTPNILYGPLLREVGHPNHLVVMWETDSNWAQHALHWTKLIGGVGRIVSTSSSNSPASGEDDKDDKSSLVETIDARVTSRNNHHQQQRQQGGGKMMIQIGDASSREPKGGEWFVVPVTTIQVDPCHFVHTAPLPFNYESPFAIGYTIRSGDWRHQDDVIIRPRGGLFDPSLEVNKAVAARAEEMKKTSSATSKKKNNTNNNKNNNNDTKFELLVGIVSDNQYGAATYRHILQHLVKHNPNMIINVGDFVDRGQVMEEWHQYYWGPLQSIGPTAASTPLLLARGNHDGESSYAYTYAYSGDQNEWFALSQGIDTEEWNGNNNISVNNVNDANNDNNVNTNNNNNNIEADKGKEKDTNNNNNNNNIKNNNSNYNHKNNSSVAIIRFIVLDSNVHPAISTKQLQWLESELQSEETRRAKFRVAILHLPPFTELWDNEPYVGEEHVRERWVPLFEKYKVDLVISGHTHAYLRGQRNGVTYTIIGGGGGHIDREKVKDWGMFNVTRQTHHYVLLQATRCQVVWRAFDLHDSLLDTITWPLPCLSNKNE